MARRNGLKGIMKALLTKFMCAKTPPKMNLKINFILLVIRSLGWTDFSAFSKGLTVAGESGIGFDPEARSANWSFVLRIMAEWGPAEVWKSVRYLELLINRSLF